MLQKDENYDDHHDEQDFYHGSYGKKEDEDYVVSDFKVLDLEDYYEDPASVQNKSFLRSGSGHGIDSISTFEWGNQIHRWISRSSTTTR